MADKTNVDTEGAGESVNPPVSDEAVAVTAAQVSEIVEKALKPIQGDIGGLYSRQDKDRDTYGDLLDEFKRQKEAGLDDNAAEAKAQATIADRVRQQKTDKVLEKLSLQLSTSPSAQSADNGTSGAIEAADAISMLEEYKIPANSPEFLDVLRKGATKESVEQFILGQVKPAPVASEAGIATSAASGVATQQQSVADLKDEYAAKVRENSGNRTVIASLRQEYAEKGVDVYSVDFS